MNDRQKELLQLLLENANQYSYVKQLAQKLHCSEKTIRNDLHVIEEFLLAYKDASLIRKRGTGISLQVNKDTWTNMYQYLNQANKTNEMYIIEMAYQLLTNRKPTTLTYLSHQYYTSPNLIKKDLDEIGQWLSQFELKIHTRQRIGSVIKGEEFNKRKALAHLSELVTVNRKRDYILAFFRAVDIQAVQKCIQEIQQHRHITFTDGSLEGLIIHALIMVKRTKQHRPMIVPEAEIEQTRKTEAYFITTDVLNRLEKEFRLTFSLSERVYYAWHMSAAIEQPSFSTDKKVDAYVSRTVHRLINHVQYLTNIPMKQDDVLYDGLVVHMNAVMQRITHHFHITNPMLSDIKRLYPYLFSMIVLALNKMREKDDMNIPEEEVAYLVLHFQASMERMEQEKTKKKVLIVCHLGTGMSLLLRAKLEQQYKNLAIIDCIGENQLQPFIADNPSIDFIISTVPLSKQSIPHVMISPLLDEKDKRKLHHFLEKGLHMSSSDVYQVLPDMIEHGLFQKDVHLNHPFEIIERLATQLVRLQRVEESFLNEILQRERASFTSIGGKIAIPHAHPSTVKESTLSVAILKNPIQWGKEMVSVVFVIAMNEKDRWQTKALLKDISQLSEDPSTMEHLLAAEDKKEMIQVLFDE